MFVVGDSMAKKEWPNRRQMNVSMPLRRERILFGTYIRTSAFLVYRLDGGGRDAESYGLGLPRENS